jgi:hypothetical protein
MVTLPLNTKPLIVLLALGMTTLPFAVGACAVPPRPEPGGTPEQSVDPRPEAELNGDIEVEDRLAPAVRDRILQTAAAEVGRPVSALRIAAAEPATWDGCMGIYVPDQACTMIAIFGLRVVVTDGDQSWVYHTREEGQGAVQNPTAISYNGLIPDFIPPQPDGDPAPEDFIFRSVESGGLAGTQYETILLADGQILQLENSTVVSQKQVTPAQLAAFQQTLEDQRFPNLNRLRYLTEAAFADHPTVRLSARHYQAEYIDLAIDDAPTALQTVVQAWEALQL